MTTKLAGPRAFSDETVRAKTGKSSTEWNALLDAWGASAKGHTAIARYLREEHGIGGWWAQSLTNRYEWERGLRVEAIVPDDLAAALDARPGARECFDALSMTCRHEHIRSIGDAKRPETRAKRIAAALEMIGASVSGSDV